MIKVDVGAYKGCTAPMRESYTVCDYASFRNEEIWESEHVLNSTRLTRRILDGNYQRVNLSKIVSNSKHLNDNKQSMLCDVLNRYELLFNGTIGIWNTKPVYIELQPGEKPYHAKPYPVP